MKKKKNCKTNADINLLQCLVDVAERNKGVITLAAVSLQKAAIDFAVF